jgi:molecular chaperone DnaK
MIPRNTTIPTSKSQVFSTFADNQSAVDVHVVQGERPLAADNKSLGKFTLSGIPPAPRGVPQIEVTFDLDANGILKVTAADKGTGKKADITITGSSTLSEEEKQRAIDEAEKQKAADEAKKTLIESKNQAENVVYQTEKLLDDMKDKIAAEDKESVNKLKEELNTLMADEEVSKSDLDAKTEQLQKELMKVGEKIYSQAAKQEASAENAEAPTEEPKPQDVESTEKPPETDTSTEEAKPEDKEAAEKKD